MDIFILFSDLLYNIVSIRRNKTSLKPNHVVQKYKLDRIIDSATSKAKQGLSIAILDSLTILFWTSILKHFRRRQWGSSLLCLFSTSPSNISHNPSEVKTEVSEPLYE